VTMWWLRIKAAIASGMRVVNVELGSVKGEGGCG
jgi:hypothetical protein